MKKLLLAVFILWLLYHGLQTYYHRHPLKIVVSWGPPLVRHHTPHYDRPERPSVIWSWASVTRPAIYIRPSSEARPWTRGYPPEDAVKWCVWDEIIQGCGDGS